MQLCCSWHGLARRVAGLALRQFQKSVTDNPSRIISHEPGFGASDAPLQHLGHVHAVGALLLA